jgi:hypothetical protein
MGMSGVGDQGHFVRLIWTAAQESGLSERMIRRAPAGDLHAKNVPVEFRRRGRVCGVYSNVADTGVLTVILLPHGGLPCRRFRSIAQAGMQSIQSSCHDRVLLFSVFSYFSRNAGTFFFKRLSVWI